MVQLPLNTFKPYRTDDPARSRGCFTCTHFHGNFYADHLLCQRDHARQVRHRRPIVLKSITCFPARSASSTSLWPRTIKPSAQVTVGTDSPVTQALLTRTTVGIAQSGCTLSLPTLT